MFTIEHDFDASVVTLVDEGDTEGGGGTLQEDVTINVFEECVTIEQLNPTTDRVQMVTFSFSQLRDLEAALDLPEGVYRLTRDPQQAD
ncbi:MAG: hypothetical protein ACRBCL_06540 [Maritimibacter sp.]